LSGHRRTGWAPGGAQFGHWIRLRSCPSPEVISLAYPTPARDGFRRGCRRPWTAGLAVGLLR
jgi:hypothetical protein